MARFSKVDILDSYSRHPLTERSILQRLGSRGRPIRELDLAVDPAGEVTDQNHVGGWRSTLRLASAATIGRRQAVLDLGAGTGGSARLLADVLGCTVHGIDFSPQRISEARSLTRLVGLADRVTFECEDLLTAPVPAATFDVLWGQDAWVQVEDKKAFVQRWAPALRSGGRIAFQDSILRRPVASVEERRLLQRLESIWHAEIVELGVWRDLLAGVGFGRLTVDDASEEMSRYFDHLGATFPGGEVIDEEREAWLLAVRLAGAGLLSYVRAVASPAE